MPGKAPKICACGNKVASGARCPCRRQQDRERKARFDKTRKTSSQRGYTGTWDMARDRFLIRHPKCAKCNSAATVVDHVKPHRGDMVLFWDRTNWQPLCSHHHNSAKQREERKYQ